MTLFEAIRAKKLFEKYRQLAFDYWNAVEPIESGPHSWMADRPPSSPRHKDTPQSLALRSQIKLMEADVLITARRLGVSTVGQSFPAPLVGGPVLPFDILAHVVDTWVGHDHLSRQQIVDAIDTCIGKAEQVRREKLGRLIRPWCWLVDVPVLLVSWPFLVMRRAGVPSSIVDSGVSQVIKTLLTAALYVLGAYLGYRAGVDEFIESFTRGSGS